MELTYTEWKDSQANELEFWRTQFASGNQEQFHRVGWYKGVCFPKWFREKGYFLDDKVCWDVGSGPEGILHHIVTARAKVAIDPLMSLFMKVGYKVNAHGVQVCESTGEYLTDVLLLQPRPDVVFCLNCLDHCHNPLIVLSNIHEVLSLRGELVLCCDMRPTELLDAYHKLQVTQDWLDGTLSEIGFTVDRWLVPHQTGNPTVQYCAICRKS